MQNKLKNEKQAILFNASQTGYCGTLSRQEAELKLQNKPDGKNFYEFFLIKKRNFFNKME